MAAEGRGRKKRSWGKTRRREVTIINREEMEETLQTLAEEVRQSKVNSGMDGENTGIHLQYPELMSNETLIKALRQLKVPIPVYPDGHPSRERLLYLYKANVLPRPQRNRWRRRKRLLSNDSKMEVAHSDDDWTVGNDGSSLPHRKRKLSDSDEAKDTCSVKRLSLESPLSKVTFSVNPSTPFLKQQEKQDRWSAGGSIKLKRPPVVSSITSVHTQTSPSSSYGQVVVVKQPSRNVITWP